jgi:hypothetical protein
MYVRQIPEILNIFIKGNKNVMLTGHLAELIPWKSREINSVGIDSWAPYN